MSRQLIGQLLSRMGKLSLIDIDEILVEQAVTHKQFGEIALSWGLCDPEHIGEAWCNQLADGIQHVDLEKVGVDAQATQYLTSNLARQLGAIPIRILGDLVVVATGHTLNSVEVAELSRTVGKQIRLVTVDPAQLQSALQTYYPDQAAA
ncbi:MAG: hypothetical protein NTU53_04495 [Planctomycetota bacterium]|nr:hypothetical protein [Planctomycetota bacterium]